MLACNDQKSVYIIFSHTHTRIGALIRLVTRHEYNHVSVALDGDFKTMYSFTRYYKNAPFVAGFSEESPLRYCSNTDEVTNVKVCKIPVSAEKHAQISEYLRAVQRDSDKYLYNLFSAALYPAGRRVQIRNSYTCIEFAIHVLSTFYVADGIYDHRFYKIIELENLLDRYKMYEGDLSGIAHPDGWGNDGYQVYIRRRTLMFSSAKRLGRLFKRVVLN